MPPSQGAALQAPRCCVLCVQLVYRLGQRVWLCRTDAPLLLPASTRSTGLAARLCRIYTKARAALRFSLLLVTQPPNAACRLQHSLHSPNTLFLCFTFVHTWRPCTLCWTAALCAGLPLPPKVLSHSPSRDLRAPQRSCLSAAPTCWAPTAAGGGSPRTTKRRWFASLGRAGSGECNSLGGWYLHRICLAMKGGACKRRPHPPHR